MTRHMQLQVNTAGAWKTVMTFGQGGETMERVKQAAQALYEASASPGTAWRITTTTGRSPVVLRHMGRNTYGNWLVRTEP